MDADVTSILLSGNNLNDLICLLNRNLYLAKIQNTHNTFVSSLFQSNDDCIKQIIVH